VAVEIVQLDSDLDKNLFLVAQWQIIDVLNMKTMIIKRSELRQAIIPVGNHESDAKTLSTACSSLSSENAEVLAALEAHP